MSDDSTFIADPSRIQAGAGATDQIADVTQRAGEKYADDTAYDVQDPPWGNDQYGRTYVQNYITPHNMLAHEGMYALIRAMRAAADLTNDSSKSFAKTQNDNINNIHDLPNPHHTRI
ncbi:MULTISPECIES: hypothetical protein [unclassified Streptomyces]|uniref:hypothetical protein n=1 Tax=unclassified Streptomyces TaxID=2593676 RepID=UPI00035E9288|nr:MULTISPECIES: hypothetical protein [unclassified Streptomyces]EYT82004.1 hypothetical protein CF54_15985 [Streptomyces sp. Tu 6176]